MLTQPIDQRLQNARRVLIAGAGSGYDVVCGLPLLFALEARGCEVHLANLTFTDLSAVTEASRPIPNLVRVTASSRLGTRLMVLSNGTETNVSNGQSWMCWRRGPVELEPVITHHSPSRDIVLTQQACGRLDLGNFQLRGFHPHRGCGDEQHSPPSIFRDHTKW